MLSIWTVPEKMEVISTFPKKKESDMNVSIQTWKWYQRFQKKSESDRGNNQNGINQLSRCCPCEDKKGESGMNAYKISEVIE